MTVLSDVTRIFCMEEQTPVLVRYQQMNGV